MNRKFIELLLCILLVLTTTGCWNSRELNTLAIVVGTGIDKAEEPDQVQVTAQIVKPEALRSSSGSKGSGSMEKSYWNITETGDTIMSTIRGFTHSSSRRLFWPHNQVLIISKDIAKTGIEKYMDLFARDHETRLRTAILISTTPTADIFNVMPPFDKISSLYIARLVESQASNSQAVDTRIKDFLTGYRSKSGASVVPIIEIIGEGDEKRLRISGTAVFKNGRMVGQLNDVETRGLLWVIGQVKSGILVLDTPGGKASFEIVKASSKMIPEIRNGSIDIKIEIKQQGNLGEYWGTQDLTELPAVKELEQASNETIQKEVMATLKKSRELDTDVFGFGNLIYQKYPQYWSGVENNWDDIFPNIDIEVKVNSRAVLAGKVNKPASSKP